MICPKCNSEIKDGSKFCTNCGEPLPKTKKCMQCGAYIKEEAFFCTNCGAKQPIKEDKSKVEEVQLKNEEITFVTKTPKKKVEQPQQKVKKEQPKSKVESKLSGKVSESKPKSSSKEEQKESLQHKPKQKQSSKSFKISWNKILLGIGLKISWSKVLFAICFISMVIYKNYFKGQENEEVTTQQYMDFSESNQLEQNSEKANNITLESFYNDYVFGNKDFSNIAHTVCSPKLLRTLKNMYQKKYKCLDGECYAMWLFRRTGKPDGVSNVSKVTNITNEGDGWVKVSYIYMGVEGETYIKLISYNGRDYMDEIRIAY